MEKIIKKDVVFDPLVLHNYILFYNFFHFLKNHFLIHNI